MTLTEACNADVKEGKDNLCNKEEFERQEELCAFCIECKLMDHEAKLETKDYIENCTLRRDYIDSMYFMVITMTTVGYGDINPESGTGQIFDCIIMMCTLIILPQ